jgi:hypothetical protein
VDAELRAALRLSVELEVGMRVQDCVGEVACWAHARRKFFLLYQLQASPIAKEALDRIGELYGIEREIAGSLSDILCFEPVVS